MDKSYITNYWLRAYFLDKGYVPDENYDQKLPIVASVEKSRTKVANFFQM